MGLADVVKVSFTPATYAATIPPPCQSLGIFTHPGHNEVTDFRPGYLP